jgi:membrane protein YqaA with SNARE-associated domain
MWGYFAVFLGALAVDLIPIFAPPAWTIMVVLLIKFDLNPWIVLFVGVLGSTIGRYIFSLYIPKVSDKIIKARKNDELEFLGKKLACKLVRAWIFVFLYSLTPLSTTALFTAAGIAKINPLHTLPPFFAGKIVSNGIMILTGSYLASNSGNLRESLLSPKSIIMLLLGLIVLGGMLFIDWRLLLEKKKFKLKFKIWK